MPRTFVEPSSRYYAAAVFADGCQRPSRRTSKRGRALRGAVLCRRGALYPLALPHTVSTDHVLCVQGLGTCSYALNDRSVTPMSTLPSVCAHCRSTT